MFLKRLKDFIRENKRQRLIRQRVIRFQKRIRESEKQSKKMRRKKLIQFAMLVN